MREGPGPCLRPFKGLPKRDVLFRDTPRDLRKEGVSIQLKGQRPPRAGEKLRLGPKTTRLSQSGASSWSRPSNIWTPPIKEEEG